MNIRERLHSLAADLRRARAASREERLEIEAARAVRIMEGLDRQAWVYVHDVPVLALVEKDSEGSTATTPGNAYALRDLIRSQYVRDMKRRKEPAI